MVADPFDNGEIQPYTSMRRCNGDPAEKTPCTVRKQVPHPGNKVQTNGEDEVIEDHVWTSCWRLMTGDALGVAAGIRSLFYREIHFRAGRVAELRDRTNDRVRAYVAMK